MKPDPVARGKTGRSWRVLGEYAPPPGSGGTEWVLAGLRASLAAICVPPSALESLKIAAIQAAARAEHCTGPAEACRPVILRVFVSPAVEGCTAPFSLGFFVLERQAGETDATDPDADRVEKRPRTHFIELYLYADADSA